MADFRLFCALVEIVPKGGKRTRLILNEIQAAYCEARTPRDAVLKARQMGLTTVEQARDIYTLLTVPGSRTVATCQSMTDHVPAKLLTANYRTMFEGLRRAGLHLNLIETAGTWILPSRDSTLRIIEAGASKAAAEKKGRAGTITRLHLTETAFYEYADDTLNALLECVPGVEYGSEIVSESTPNGAAGTFYNQCIAARGGRSGWTFHFFPWYRQREYRCALPEGGSIAPETDRENYLVKQCKIDSEQLLWYRRKVAQKGQALTDQEYPSDPDTCFLQAGRCFFDWASVSNLLSHARAPIVYDNQKRYWNKPLAGHAYLIAADPAEGKRDSDYSAAIVYDLSTGEHVATLRDRLEPWQFARAIASLGYEFNHALVAVERNNHGHAVLQALTMHCGYLNLHYGKDGRLGWHNNAATRPMALDHLADSLRTRRWSTSDRLLIDEMTKFIVSDTGRPEAARGAHDDLVLAAAIGWDVARCPRPYRNLESLPVA